MWWRLIPVIGHNKIIDSLVHPEMSGSCWKEILDRITNQTIALLSLWLEVISSWSWCRCWSCHGFGPDTDLYIVHQCILIKLNFEFFKNISKIEQLDWDFYLLWYFIPINKTENRSFKSKFGWMIFDLVGWWWWRLLWRHQRGEFESITRKRQGRCFWGNDCVGEDNQNAATNQQRINDDSVACDHNNIRIKMSPI